MKRAGEEVEGIVRAVVVKRAEVVGIAEIRVALAVLVRPVGYHNVEREARPVDRIAEERVLAIRLDGYMERAPLQARTHQAEYERMRVVFVAAAAMPDRVGIAAEYAAALGLDDRHGFVLVVAAPVECFGEKSVAARSVEQLEVVLELAHAEEVSSELVAR